MAPDRGVGFLELDLSLKLKRPVALLDRGVGSRRCERRGWIGATAAFSLTGREVPVCASVAESAGVLTSRRRASGRATGAPQNGGAGSRVVAVPAARFPGSLPGGLTGYAPQSAPGASPLSL